MTLPASFPGTTLKSPSARPLKEHAGMSQPTTMKPAEKVPADDQ